MSKVYSHCHPTTKTVGITLSCVSHVMEIREALLDLFMVSCAIHAVFITPTISITPTRPVPNGLDGRVLAFIRRACDYGGEVLISFSICFCSFSLITVSRIISITLRTLSGRPTGRVPVQARMLSATSNPNRGLTSGVFSSFYPITRHAALSFGYAALSAFIIVLRSHPSSGLAYSLTRAENGDGSPAFKIYYRKGAASVSGGRAAFSAEISII